MVTHCMLCFVDSWSPPTNAFGTEVLKLDPGKMPTIVVASKTSQFLGAVEALKTAGSR